MHNLGVNIKSRHVLDLDNYLNSSSFVNQAGIDYDRLPSMFWLKDLFGDATPGAARQASIKAPFRLIGAICLAYIAAAVLDPQLNSLSRSLLPQGPVPAEVAVKPGSLALQDALSPAEESWRGTLIIYKQLLAEENSARRIKAKHAENQKLLSRLEAWMQKGAAKERWRLVVVDSNPANRRKH
jgi:hypothetical protein